MGKHKLVIVESPMKARTIKKFLPKNFIVEASMGHVADLPQSASDIPPKLKGEAWSKLGVNVEKDFEPLYVVPKGKSKIITHLRQLLKDAEELYLATDEDREGESISWHLVRLLNPKIPVKRMVFHEITKSAIEDALKNCRTIDQELVSSQETRRILDRLVGYTLSPLIWKKVAFGLSAGRVQSAGLRLLVERERERMAFKKAIYWDLKANLEKDEKEFEARLITFQGKRVASGKDFDANTGSIKEDTKDLVLLNEERAKKLVESLKNETWKVESVDSKEFNSKPFPPFITSTLQQEANRKLGMSARQAMRTAQALYEQGLITYMRTDSPSLSQQAMAGARNAVQSLYGKEFLSPEPRQFSSKSKAAQEAHEAIRPAGEDFKHPKEIEGLNSDQAALYDLIWKRTLASQMAEARKLSMTVKIQAGDAGFSASGMKIVFAGYLRAYVEGKDDPEAALDDREVLLPSMNTGDQLKMKTLDALYHETKPPARYTEASLVQRLEKEGIGRPSTYASIISTIQDRGYVRKVGNALIPTFTGFIVIQLLEKHFSDLVDYQFTSTMENDLDQIASGEKPWLPYLKSFYLGDRGLQKQVEKKDKEIDPDDSRQVHDFHLETVSLRVGRFGPYIVREAKGKKKEDVRASIPEDVAPADLTAEMIDEILEASEKGPQSLGKHPDTQEDVYVLLGRYGPYVQLGELTEENPKPKRASVPKELDYRNLTLGQAVDLLRLPYEVGKHPETGLPIVANRGRFGPYIVHNEDFRSLKKEDDVYSVSLERALEILSEEKKTQRGSKLLKDFDKHPTTKKKLAIYTGKYGPYIKHGTKNISLPKDTDPEKCTLDDLVKIINEAPAKKKR